MTATDFKRRISSRLKTEPLDAILAEVRRPPPRQAVSPLIAGLFNTDSNVRWHAVSALGVVMALLAKEDMEAARNIMRRLMWSLNDESGSIGWGVPEAMAEIMPTMTGSRRNMPIFWLPICGKMDPIWNFFPCNGASCGASAVLPR
jgi:hypothetical protein